MPTPLQLAPRLAAPLGAALGAFVLARGFIAPGVDLEGMARGLAGPGTWPKIMLYCAAACAAAVFVRNLAGLRRARASADDTEYDDAKLAAGIALLIGFGFAISYAGIAWATLAFLAGWLLVSGLRRPLTVTLVSVFGTVGVLYLFVKICLMPLERGRGVFEQATIALYRVLGIY